LFATRGLNFLGGLGLELCGAALVLILQDHERDVPPFHVRTRERILKHGEGRRLVVRIRHAHARLVTERLWEQVLGNTSVRILDCLLTVRKVMAGDMILGHVIHCIFLPLDAFSGVGLIPVLITLDSRFVACIRDRGRVTVVGVGVGVGVVQVSTVVTVGAPVIPYTTETSSSLVSPYRWPVIKVAGVSFFPPTPRVIKTILHTVKQITQSTRVLRVIRVGSKV